MTAGMLGQCHKPSNESEKCPVQLSSVIEGSNTRACLRFVREHVREEGFQVEVRKASPGLARPGQAWPAPHHRLWKLTKIHNYSFDFKSARLSCRLILFALVPPDVNPSTLRSSKVPDAYFCCCVDGYFWGQSEPRPRSWHHPALTPQFMRAIHVY